MESIVLLLLSVITGAAFWSEPVLGKTTKCETCRELVKGFSEGVKRTARFNFAGGDVAWEEENKLSYATSETRLVEVLESTCGKHDDKCFYMLEEHEELIETWWLKKQEKYPDLKDWLCRIRLRACCPANTFGKDCQPCPGGVDKPCGGNGTCEGEGDREGSGKCVCKAGYTGVVCETCLEGYYNDTEHNDCLSCHRACVLNCTGPGPANCDVCNDGWDESTDGCLDVNECERAEGPCPTGQYCVNNEGSYSCRAARGLWANVMSYFRGFSLPNGMRGWSSPSVLIGQALFLLLTLFTCFRRVNAACHRACAANCSGPQAGDCESCATGYHRTQEPDECADVDECEDPEKSGCEVGTYCVNMQGSFYCQLCDIACTGGCNGSGPGHCVQCADGYEDISSVCSDVDECASSPCPDTEDCTNTFGSFSCDCKAGHERNNGTCTPKPDDHQIGEEAAAETMSDVQAATAPTESGVEKDTETSGEQEANEDIANPAGHGHVKEEL